jgi:hypothetical protein
MGSNDRYRRYPVKRFRLGERPLTATKETHGKGNAERNTPRQGLSAREQWYHPDPAARRRNPVARVRGEPGVLCKQQRLRDLLFGGGFSLG